MSGLIGRNRGQAVTGATDASTAYSTPVAPPETNYQGSQGGFTDATGARPAPVADPHNAPIVNRRDRRNGIQDHYVYGATESPYQFAPPQVQSSKFQDMIIRLHPYMINLGWYIAYPAATVMNGGKRNQGLTERTPQLQTRTTGGPGYFLMGPRPQFRSVQQVPRYSTAPSTYNTKGTAN